MIYEFGCSHCGNKFEVWKPMSEFTREAVCDCGGTAMLIIHAPIGFINARVEHAEYNPGLGCVVKNRTHRAELARQRGLVEVGNDISADKMLKEAEQTLEKKLKYEEI